MGHRTKAEWESCSRACPGDTPRFRCSVLVPRAYVYRIDSHPIKYLTRNVGNLVSVRHLGVDSGERLHES